MVVMERPMRLAKGRAFFNSRKEVLGSNGFLSAVGMKPCALVDESLSRGKDVLLGGREVGQEVLPFFHEWFVSRRLETGSPVLTGDVDIARPEVKGGLPSAPST